MFIFKKHGKLIYAVYSNNKAKTTGFFIFVLFRGCFCNAIAEILALTLFLCPPPKILYFVFLYEFIFIHKTFCCLFFLTWCHVGYVDVGLIPEGAWDILIEEVAEAGNFLALRSDNPSRYFLNGGWTIQWNGEYKAAGAVFTYERTGQLENLTSPGPTMEPLWIQVGYFLHTFYPCQ